MQDEILNSRQVMKLLGICENTLLKLEKDFVIEIDFRLNNRKRYYKLNILKAFEKERKRKAPRNTEN